MGRPKRVQYPNACYYIVLSGNNRQDIFLSNQDRRQFLSLLKTYKERSGLKIYAYCLMSHEAHLLLETAQPNLSSAMQGFNTVYTKYFNAAHNTVGHVFQGRYKALIVDAEKHLAEVTRFIHLQPARAGLKEKPWRYQWSSCSSYVEVDAREPLVEPDAVLGKLAKFRLKQSVRYLQSLKDQLKAHPAPALPVFRGMVIGDEAFLAKVLAQGAGGGPAKPPAEAEARRIIADMAAKHGIPEDKLLGRLQWREISAVRRRAIHRIWKETRMGVTELARLFNRTPSAVSQLIRAMETGVV